MTDPLKASCSGCGKTQATKPTKDGSGLKCPWGWKSVGFQVLCPACVKSKYIVRAVRIGIFGIDEAKSEGRTLAEFRKTCSAAAVDSGRFANWMSQRLWAADLAVDPANNKTDKGGKLKMAKVGDAFGKDAYREATKRFKNLAPASIVAMAKMVRGWYCADRFESLVMLKRSVRSYLFAELPIEIPKQAWSLRKTADGKLVIVTQVAPGSSWYVTPIIDRRAAGVVKQLLSGDAEACALKIVRANKHRIDGAPPRRTWFFRITVLLPRKAARASHQEITLTLGHDPGALLFGSLDGSDEVFEFSGASLKKMIVGGDKSDRAWQSEQSMQRGIWSRRKRARWSLDRTRRCESRRRKIKDQIKLAAASLTRWCVRMGVTSVDYDIADRAFVPHFPRRELRDAIHCALENEGIGLHVLDADTEAGALAGRGSETDE